MQLEPCQLSVITASFTLVVVEMPKQAKGFDRNEDDDRCQGMLVVLIVINRSLVVLFVISKSL